MVKTKHPLVPMNDGWYRWPVTHNHNKSNLLPIAGQVYRIEADNMTQVFKVLDVREHYSHDVLGKPIETSHRIEVSVDWDWYLKKHE